MQKETMLHIVKATRMARKMSDLIAQMFPFEEMPNVSLADTIYGELTDALFAISGDSLTPEESFSDSRTFKVIDDPSITDEAAAMIFLDAEEKAKKNSISCSESISIISEEIQNLKTWINRSANAMTAKELENRNLRETITDVARTTCLHCNASKSKCEMCNVKNWARGDVR